MTNRTVASSEAMPRHITSFEASDRYREAVHDLIPGGAHTYSKGDDQFPALSPAAIVRGKGGRVWDLDGNTYVDVGLGLGAVSLGHAYEPVLRAVREQIALGSAFQRPAAIELEFARELAEAIPGAERVKFAKNGSTVTTAAVKLARGFTGRPLVAFPGNHPFYSYDDWYVGSTLCNGGIPEEIKSLSVVYDSTRPESLERLFNLYPQQIACVITEPEEVILQAPDIVREVGRIARRGGAVFVLDEMVTGYRSDFPGAGARYGVEADLSTWGKSIGNGFSFAALTGRADIMDLGGIKQRVAPRVFLISSTHGGEAHAIAAAQATLREYQSKDVLGHQRRIVAQAAEGMARAVDACGLEDSLRVHASPWRIIVVCKDRDGAVSPTLRALLIQEMIGRGVLFPGYFLPCFEHNEADIDHFIRAFAASAQVYSEALEVGTGEFLVGEGSRPVFRRYNGCSGQCPSSPCPLEDSCRAR
jgi:glutamate-1-semialdehyde 2,1-aminomutase